MSVATRFALPLLAPVVDAYALVALVVSHHPAVLAFWLGFDAIQVLAVLVAFRLAGEPLPPIWLLAARQYVYRYLRAAAIIRTLIDVALRAEPRWHRELRPELEAAG